MRAFLLALVVVAFPLVASAQTGPCPDPCELRPSQAVSASFTHTGSVPGSPVTGFRLYLKSDGGTPVKVGNDIALSALQNGAALVAITAPATQGVFELTATAFNSAGESVHSVPARFSVIGPPSPPGKPTLFIAITVAADGTVQFRVVDATQVK